MGSHYVIFITILEPKQRILGTRGKGTIDPGHRYTTVKYMVIK